MGRATLFAAIDRIGAASASPVTNTFPIISTAIAVISLGEALTLQIIAGTILTIAGLFVLSQKKGEHKEWKLRYLGIALLSSFFFGVGTGFQKAGLNSIPAPFFGVTVTFYSALGLYLALLVTNRSKFRPRVAQGSLRYFVAGGIANSLGQLTLFGALNRGLVSVVGPLASIVPLFVLILAHFFLREYEVIDRRVAVGALLVVAGVSLVAA